MYELQVARLRAAFPATFNQAEAVRVVARAYGYQQLDLDTGTFSDPVPGLQVVKPYSEILKLDPTHQMLQFVRMALNISLPSNEDLREGIPEREIVRTMLGFSDFDALINYARSAPVDPHSADPVMLQRFKSRYGFYSPGQYLLGRFLYEHTLVVQPDDDKAGRIVDQELCLNPLDNMRIAVLRTSVDADVRLRVYMRGLETLRGSFDDLYSAAAEKAFKKSPVVVSIVPDQRYALSELVEQHVTVLANNAPDGRTLIVDRLSLLDDPADLDKAYQLATSHQVHLVVIVSQPDAKLWHRSGIRLIFGFDKDIASSDFEMDTMIAYGNTFIGFKNGKMMYLYHSAASGPRFAAMDLIPDDAKTVSLLDRLRNALRA